MRWSAPAAAFMVLILSGCVSGNLASSQDCSSSTNQVAAVQRSLLLPEEPPGSPYQEDGNRISVAARAGQDLVAVATWHAAAGAAQVNFDGPSTHQVSTQKSWTMTTYDVPAGEYSLEMVGAPFAFDAVYTMQIVASGCTPA
jgi:hypothetical protein